MGWLIEVARYAGGGVILAIYLLALGCSVILGFINNGH
jgi:hypothetical protein